MGVLVFLYLQKLASFPTFRPSGSEAAICDIWVMSAIDRSVSDSIIRTSGSIRTRIFGFAL